MLVDLAHEIQLVAPPRTWAQDTHQLGSKRCLQVLLNAASALRGRPLPYRIAFARRVPTIQAVGDLADALGAKGAWSEADQDRRDAFVATLDVAAPGLPSAVADTAQTGEVPFSRQEFARVKRRAQAL